MADYDGYKHRCGHCGNKGDEGRCVKCGSSMEDEDHAIEGARYPHWIKRWLASRDRGWEVADGMRTELALRHIEDLREGRDPKRFDGIPDPYDETL